MRTVRPFVPLAAMLLLALAAGLTARAADRAGYEPQADPFEQVKAATAQARVERKLVLLVSGGEWCSWCHYLKAFLENNADIDAALHEVFVVQKVYVGEDNTNEKFFATLPKADGAPHFWILSATGEVLASQGTLALEDGDKSYDKRAFRDFIAKWRTR